MATSTRTLTQVEFVNKKTQEYECFYQRLEEGAQTSPMHALNNGLEDMRKQWKDTKKQTDEFIAQVANTANIAQMIKKGPEELAACKKALTVAIDQSKLVDESMAIAEEILNEVGKWGQFYRNWRLAYRKLSKQKESQARLCVKKCVGRVPQNDKITEKLTAIATKWQKHSEKLMSVSEDFKKLKEQYEGDAKKYRQRMWMAGIVAGICILTVVICVATGGVGVLAIGGGAAAASSATATGAAGGAVVASVLFWSASASAVLSTSAALGFGSASTSAKKSAKVASDIANSAKKSAAASIKICNLTKEIKELVRKQSDHKSDLQVDDLGFNPTFDELFEALELMVMEAEDLGEEATFDCEKECENAIKTCKELQQQVGKLHSELIHMGADVQSLSNIEKLRTLIREQEEYLASKGSCVVM